MHVLWRTQRKEEDFACCLLSHKMASLCYLIHWIKNVSWEYLHTNLNFVFDQNLVLGYDWCTPIWAWLASVSPDGFIWIFVIWSRYLCMVLISWQMYAQAKRGECNDEGSYASEKNLFHDELDLPMKKELLLCKFDLSI